MVVGIVKRAELGMLAAPDVVIRQELGAEGEHGELGEESGGGVKVVVVGIDAFDEGDAYDEGLAGFGQGADVGKDGGVRYAAVVSVLCRVDKFEIDEE